MNAPSADYDPIVEPIFFAHPRTRGTGGALVRGWQPAPNPAMARLRVPRQPERPAPALLLA